jgi:hypothetical protein
MIAMICVILVILSLVSPATRSGPTLEELNSQIRPFLVEPVPTAAERARVRPVLVRFLQRPEVTAALDRRGRAASRPATQPALPDDPEAWAEAFLDNVPRLSSPQQPLITLDDGIEVLRDWNVGMPGLTAAGIELYKRGELDAEEQELVRRFVEESVAVLARAVMPDAGERR